MLPTMRDPAMPPLRDPGPPLRDPGPHWTESALLALEPNEHDFQEFKASPYLVDGDGIAGPFLAALSKQVSAFANGAGGRLFLGLDDQGLPDGGIPIGLKGGGTRAWLEDVIPGSVDPPLKGFNVFEVQSNGGRTSRIGPGHAVYVIEIEASEFAPHQANDHRYYLRIAGKSRPMGHVHVQDVLRRTRHPAVDVVRVSPYGAMESVDDDPRGPKNLLCLQVFVANQGRNLARHVGLELILPRPLVNSEARGRILEPGDMQLTQKPGALTFFRHHPTPLFPGQEIHYARIWVALHTNNIDAVRREELGVGWRVYADDAPARDGHAPLWRYAQVRRAVRALKQRSRGR